MVDDSRSTLPTTNQTSVYQIYADMLTREMDRSVYMMSTPRRDGSNVFWTEWNNATAPTYEPLEMTVDEQGNVSRTITGTGIQLEIDHSPNDADYPNAREIAYLKPTFYECPNCKVLFAGENEKGILICENCCYEVPKEVIERQKGTIYEGTVDWKLQRAAEKRRKEKLQKSLRRQLTVEDEDEEETERGPDCPLGDEGIDGPPGPEYDYEDVYEDLRQEAARAVVVRSQIVGESMVMCALCGSRMEGVPVMRWFECPRCRNRVTDEAIRDARGEFL